MNTEFIKDERAEDSHTQKIINHKDLLYFSESFICKYCDNTTLDPILNKRMPYYYKFPSCDHELCYTCIEKLSHNHHIKLKDINCNICNNNIKFVPDLVKHDFINSNNPFKNELSMYYGSNP